MPRPRKSVPSYRLHKPSGNAYADFTDPLTGRRRSVCLGTWDSPVSRAEHARLCAEVAAGRSATAACGITLNEVFVAFLQHAERHYRRPDGTPTHETDNFKAVIAIARVTHGHNPAAEFGPLALKAVRQAMVDRGWARTTVNAQTRRLRCVVRWAVENELVPGSVLEGLRAVAGLKAGRTDAPEPAPVLPVAESVVERTLPHLNRHVAGLVRFMRLTGCRPGEAVVVRRCDIDTSSPVWVFTPPRHKTSHRGQRRVIHVGPKARALLAEFPTTHDGEYIFSPRRERDERSARRAAERATKYYRSRQAWQTRASAPKRQPGERYTTCSFGYAVRRACRAAGVKPWHPNQLRHLRATEVRAAFGLESAQVVLGHAKADVTQLYAEKNEGLAASVAAAIG